MRVDSVATLVASLSVGSVLSDEECWVAPDQLPASTILAAHGCDSQILPDWLSSVPLAGYHVVCVGAARAGQHDVLVFREGSPTVSPLEGSVPEGSLTAFRSGLGSLLQVCPPVSQSVSLSVCLSVSDLVSQSVSQSISQVVSDKECRASFAHA